MFTSGSLTTFSFDSEYMRRLAEGDPSVEQHFTTYFGRLIFLKLRGRVRSAQLAEDMKQETFLRVLEQIRSKRGIDQPERLGGFVNGVCHRVMMEFFRSEGRHPQLQESAPDPPTTRSTLKATWWTTRESVWSIPFWPSFRARIGPYCGWCSSRIWIKTKSAIPCA